MRKKRYFAISDYSSEEYFTKKEALKDLINYGAEEVILYSLNASNNYSSFEVSSEDIIGIYKEGKRIK